MADKKIRTAKSLSDLAAPIVNVNIDDVDENGEAFEWCIRLKTLTLGQWLAAGRRVPPATPPIKGAGAGGQPIYDVYNPEYQRQRELVEERRLYHRLLDALILDESIPGDTVEERVAALESQLSARIANSLFNVLLEQHNAATARLSGRADSFRRSGTADVESPDR